MESVAIAGVGLIGGSFGLALRQAGFRGRIAGISSARSIETGLRMKAIDQGIELDEARSYDLIFLAQPISGIIATLPKLAGSQAVITDAGSTKRSICQAAAHLPNFVGGHPMAGKESRGVEAAEANLFQGRPWLFTSEPPRELRRWVEAIGAHILVMTPEDHDRLVGLASHLPQVVSNILAKVSAPGRPVGGPGLDSMTRLSRSSYDIWKDIFATNKDQIAAALDEFLREGETLQKILESDDLSLLRDYFGRN